MANQQPLPETQLAEVAEEWTRAFYGRIPEKHLSECFEDVAYFNGSKFAVNAQEILGAWNVKSANLRIDEAKRCIQWQNHIHGKPETKICHPDGTRDVIVPCVFCSPAEFHAVHANMVAQTPEPYTGGVFQMVAAATSGIEAAEVRDLFVRIFGQANNVELRQSMKKRFRLLEGGKHENVSDM